MKARRTGRPLGEVLEELVGQLGIREKLSEYDAVLQWETVVGSHIAKIARAERITQGVLFVRVTASTWRNELNMRKEEIRSRLNTALGADVVKDIRFR